MPQGAFHTLASFSRAGGLLPEGEMTRSAKQPAFPDATPVVPPWPLPRGGGDGLTSSAWSQDGGAADHRQTPVGLECSWKIVMTQCEVSENKRAGLQLILLFKKLYVVDLCLC